MTGACVTSIELRGRFASTRPCCRTFGLCEGDGPPPSPPPEGFRSAVAHPLRVSLRLLASPSLREGEGIEMMIIRLLGRFGRSGQRICGLLM